MGEEFLQRTQRTQGQLGAPTWQLTTLTPVPGGDDALSGLCGHCMHKACIHANKTLTCKMKINNPFKKKTKNKTRL